MKANELRIGNLVSFMGKTQCKVYSVDQNGETPLIIGYSPELFENFAEREESNYDPIPLTEERLARFGFVFNNDKRCYDLKGISFFIGTKSVMCYVHGVKCICDKVHELQNLYFALTGEELTIA